MFGHSGEENSELYNQFYQSINVWYLLDNQRFQYFNANARISVLNLPFNEILTFVLLNFKFEKTKDDFSIRYKKL